MNKDSHLLFEAYHRALTEKHLHHGEFAKIEKEAEKHYHSKKAGERVAGAIKAKVEAEDAQETDDERYNREAGELEAVMKQHKPEFQHTPFWDAYKAVKDGLWSEEEFHQWASSVWSDGANHAQGMGEDCEGVWKDYGKTGHIDAEDEEVPGTEEEEDDDDDTIDGDAAEQPGVV